MIPPRMSAFYQSSEAPQLLVKLLLVQAYHHQSRRCFRVFMLFNVRVFELLLPEHSHDLPTIGVKTNLQDTFFFPAIIVILNLSRLRPVSPNAHKKST